jgi:hypothetical protein
MLAEAIQTFFEATPSWRVLTPDARRLQSAFLHRTASRARYPAPVHSLAVFSGHGLEVWRGGVGPRQQIIDAGVEMAGDDAVQHISEIGLRIHLAQFARLDQ